MNIILNVHTIITFVPNSAEKIDWTGWIQTIMSIITVVLGVVTIVIGKKIITSKRENAKYGFYINFLAFVERFKSILSEYPGITAHLVTKELRDEHIKTATEDDIAERVIPIFTTLCDEFMDFITKSDNNVVPEHWKNATVSEEKEWNDWYDNIKCLVLYTQKCQLLKQNLNPYFTTEQLDAFVEENNNFEKSLEYIYAELKKAIIYPPRKKKEEKKKQ